MNIKTLKNGTIVIVSELRVKPWVYFSEKMKLYVNSIDSWCNST